MSVGGKVVEIVDCGDRLWVNTREQKWDATLGVKRDYHCSSLGCGCHDCAVYVERTPEARCIEPGDSLWWQGHNAMWTPRAGNRFGGKSDIRIPRIGCSGVSRPPAEEKPR